jgi:hypothetical protein
MPGSSALIATGLIIFRPDDDNANLARENKKESFCCYLSNCLLCLFCWFM